MTTYVVMAYSRRKKRNENRYEYFWKEVRFFKAKFDADKYAQKLSADKKGTYIVQSRSTVSEYRNGSRAY